MLHKKCFIKEQHVFHYKDSVSVLVSLVIIPLWFKQVQTSNLETPLSQQQKISWAFHPAAAHYVKHESKSSRIQLLFISVSL